MSPVATKKRAAARKKTAPKKAPSKRVPRNEFSHLSKSVDDKITISPKMILAWTYHMVGWTQEDIAKHIGVHRNTVHSMLERVAIMLDEKIDVEAIRKSMLKLLPHAIGGLVKALDRGDGIVLRDYFQEMGVYLGKTGDAPNVNLNVNFSELREQNQREGLAKLNVVVNHSDMD